MKRVVSFLLVFICLCCIPLNAFAATYGKATDAINGVARIVTKGTVEYYDEDYNLLDTVEDVIFRHGSAFAVGNKGEPVSYFVTNRHVISSETGYDEYYTSDGELIYCETYPKSFYIIFDNEANLHPIKIVSNNSGGADLAVIKLNESTSEREPCALRPYKDSSELRGLTVLSVGYPGSGDIWYEDNVDYASGTDRISTRKGIIDREEVDKVDSYGPGKLLVTDAAISGGNSGGPLVDEKGGVLGVCTFSSVADQNMHAAVSVNEVIKLLDKEDIPYITVSDMNPKAAWYIYAGLGAVIIAAIAVLIKLIGGGGGKTIVPPLPPKPPATRSTRVLIGVSGPLKDQRYTLKAGGKLLIGRDAKCDVRFKDGTPGVSSMHCEIRFDGKKATITDLKSSYGTFVDHQKLKPNTPTTLHRSLAIDIGTEKTSGTEKNIFVLQ